MGGREQREPCPLRGAGDFCARSVGRFRSLFISYPVARGWLGLPLSARYRDVWICCLIAASGGGSQDGFGCGASPHPQTGELHPRRIETNGTALLRRTCGGLARPVIFSRFAAQRVQQYKKPFRNRAKRLDLSMYFCYILCYKNIAPRSLFLRRAHDARASFKSLQTFGTRRGLFCFQFVSEK